MASAQALPAPYASPGEIEPPVPLPISETERPLRRPDSVGAGEPHIALLLPLESKTFARHAGAVRDGFLAAATTQAGGPPVRVQPTGDDPERALDAYIAAVNAGARVVVGPLTRDSVAAVMTSAVVMVPTLVLNVPDGAIVAPVDLYTLSLHIESEARQAAQLAHAEGFRNAVTIADATPLFGRMLNAFLDEFLRLGGAHAAHFEFSSDPEALTAMRKSLETSPADMAFLALDFARARLARPYFGTLPVYATSQVNPGATGPLAAFDLADVRFLDMPWLLQPDHPAVMVYPRSVYGEDAELERFYALGIDAYRLARALLAGTAEAGLDGVTGRLTLQTGQRFQRALTPARYSNGRLVVHQGP